MILDVHAELLSMSLQHTEAQKVEPLRASPPSGGSVAGGEPPELDQPGLALVEHRPNCSSLSLRSARSCFPSASNWQPRTISSAYLQTITCPAARRLRHWRTQRSTT